MLNRVLSFLEYPPAVRNALSFLLGGWLSIFMFMYHLNWRFPEQAFNNAVILRVMAVGIGICYFVFRIKPWARKLCIFFNFGNIAWFIVWALGIATPALRVHAVLTIVLFGLSSYYLMIKKTSQFFKEREPQKFDETGKEIK